MAQIFSHVPRLLYLDNDIIVSCCIEEIWGSKFGFLLHSSALCIVCCPYILYVCMYVCMYVVESSVAVGVVLDDLKWATATQWQRHYNASHPLVAKHLMRGIKRYVYTYVYMYVCM